MNNTTVADAVMRTLEKIGIRRIFGIPGGASMYLDDAATKKDTSIIYTLCGDEIGAGFQAQAYGTIAREFGYDTVGVVQVTSGPAAIKLFTAMRNSRDDSQPLLAFTGNVPRNAPPDPFQGCDVVPAVLAGKLAKHAIYVDDPGRAPRLVLEGYRTAVGGRPGSVLLDFPRDVLASSITYGSLDDLLQDEQLLLPMKFNASIDGAIVREIAHALRMADKPIVVIGQGARGASRELAELLEQEDLYAITSLFGADAISANNTHNLGMGGMHGNSYANLAHARSKFRMYLGSSIDDRLMLSSHEGQLHPYKEVTIVHVDIDPGQIGKVIRPTYGIVGDVKEFVRLLHNELKTIDEPSNHVAWNAQIKNWRKQLDKPDYSDIQTLISEHVIDELERVFRDSYVITDVGAHQMRYVARTGRTKLTSGRLGCMGYAFGASIGIVTAMNDYDLPRKPVLVAKGDGGSIMDSHEWFDVARCVAEFGPERVPLKVVIFVDGVLGMVNFWLDGKHNGNTASSDLTCQRKINFDFTKIPQAYPVDLPSGKRFTVSGRIVASRSDLSGAVEEMYSTPGPYLLQVMVPPRDVAPVIFPGQNTGTATHGYSNGKPIPLAQVLREKGL